MDCDIGKLQKAAWNVRARILQMANRCNGNVHIGGALSMSDLLTVLYKKTMKYDFADPAWEARDRFILSKGHCVLALYAVLAECGLLTDADIALFQVNGSRLCAHPVMDLDIGIESSNGSLGQGISMAVGIAKTAKMLKKTYKVYTLIGNGESNEGSVWEAAMLASQWKLDNLTVIIDNNAMQSDGISDKIMSMESMTDKWSSFGFDVFKIDGHNVADISKAYDSRTDGKPKAVIAETIKGHGISFMENDPQWHHNRLTDQLYEQAMEELKGERHA